MHYLIACMNKLHALLKCMHYLIPGVADAASSGGFAAAAVSAAAAAAAVASAAPLFHCMEYIIACINLIGCINLIACLI